MLSAKVYLSHEPVKLLHAPPGHKKQAQQLASAHSSPTGGHEALKEEYTTQGTGVGGTKFDSKLLCFGWYYQAVSHFHQHLRRLCSASTGKGS